jgi:hypothetical protein
MVAQQLVLSVLRAVVESEIGKEQSLAKASLKTTSTGRKVSNTRAKDEQDQSTVFKKMLPL